MKYKLKMIISVTIEIQLTEVCDLDPGAGKG